MKWERLYDEGEKRALIEQERKYIKKPPYTFIQCLGGFLLYFKGVQSIQCLKLTRFTKVFILYTPFIHPQIIEKGDEFIIF